MCMICTCVCVVCETITFCFSYNFLWEQLTSIRQSIHIDGHVRNSTKHSKQLFSLIWSKAAAIVALPFEAWIDFCSLALLSFILPSLHPSLRTLSLSLSLSIPLSVLSLFLVPDKLVSFVSAGPCTNIRYISRAFSVGEETQRAEWERQREERGGGGEKEEGKDKG